MRILHTSDLHLGIDIHGMSMLDEQENFINTLHDIISQNKIDAVIIAGDIYDHSVSNSSAIELYNKLTNTICLDCKIPMFVIAGNHDGAARLSAMKNLLEKSGLYITGILTNDIIPVKIGNTAIYSIPYFNSDRVKSLYPEKEIVSYEDAAMVVCDNIRESMDKNLTNIVIAHTFVSGAKLSDSDTSAIIGSSAMISKDVFKGFDYVALGHLHGPQNIGENCRYSGSPIKYSFSEANQLKSVTIFDTVTKEISTIPIKPLNEMKIIKSTYDELINKFNNDNCYLKIELTDCPLGIEILNTLKSLFPNLLTVTGKSYDTSDDTVTMSINEIKTLSPKKIVEHFFSETYNYLPKDNQVSMFLEAFSEIENGGDLS